MRMRIVQRAKSDVVWVFGLGCNNEVQRICVLIPPQVPQGALLGAFPCQEEGYDCGPFQRPAD